MTNTGSFPRYDNSQDDDIRALKWRYDNWTPTVGPGKDFDQAVYNLIGTVLVEAEDGHTGLKP